MNPPKPPVACGREVAKLAHDPDADAKQRRGDDQDQDRFENGEDKLEVAGLLDAEIIQAGHEPGDADGKDLRPEQRAGRRWRVEQE